MREYGDILALLNDLNQYAGIHIECGQETEQEILESFRRNRDLSHTAFVCRTDRGYDRQTVAAYLKFFQQLLDSKRSYKEAMKEFDLEEIKKQKLRGCTDSQHMRINFARISLAESRCYFLQNPLADIDGHSQAILLAWIGRKSEEGVKFVTTTPSMRHALLLPGTAFYREGSRYIEIQQQETAGPQEEGEPAIRKIAAKSGAATLLFEPKNIDYIESLNKSNFVSVRNNSYQVSYTMDELEAMLKQFGFFRCHRSYLVNVQKIEEMEKWTKNSYGLRLNNEQHSQIPLAKGRVTEMKELYHW